MNKYQFQYLGMIIPDRMRSKLENYLIRGIPEGDFLSAVISNNLKEAVVWADDENIRVLPAYVNFFYNHAPPACWGSEEKMEAWIERHRIE